MRKLLLFIFLLLIIFNPIFAVTSYYWEFSSHPHQSGLVFEVVKIMAQNPFQAIPIFSINLLKLLIYISIPFAIRNLYIIFFKKR